MVSLLCTVNTNWFPAGTVITSGLNRSPFMSNATSVVFPVPPAVTTPEDPPEPPSTKPPNEAITSANTHGASSATSGEGVEGRIAGEVDLVLDGGPSPLAAASTIVDCTGADPRVLREGAIPSVGIMRVADPDAWA